MTGSSKTASLSGLPTELTQLMCESLELNDLLSLRSTDMKRANNLIHSLTPLLAPKLQRLQVLRTHDGLLALYGLLTIPEWRNCIQSIELVDHGLYDIRRMETEGERTLVPRWLGHFALTGSSIERIRRDVAPAQLEFEAGDGDEASILLNKIFAYLQQAEKLEAIHIGLTNGEKHPVAGLGPLLRSVCLGKANLDSCMTGGFNKYAANQDLGPYFQQGELPEGIDYAIKYSGFSKQVLHFKIDNTHVLQPETLPAESRWSLSTILPRMSPSYVQSVTIIETQHLVTDTAPDESTPPTTILAPSVTIHGPLYCGGTCALCLYTPRLLLSTSFLALTSLTLRDLFFTFPSQVLALLTSVPTLTSLSLSSMMLKQNSFLSVFLTWSNTRLTPLLTKLELDQLMQPAPTNAKSYWYSQGRRDRSKVVLEGCTDCVRGWVGRMARECVTVERKPVGDLSCIALVWFPKFD